MKMKVIFYIPFTIVELTIVRRHEVYRKKSSLRKKVYEQVENTKRSWSEKISVLLFLNVHSS